MFYKPSVVKVLKITVTLLVLGYFCYFSFKSVAQVSG